MRFADWMLEHRRSILFLMLLLALGGVFSAFQTPVGLFPTVMFPRVVVTLDAGDRPVESMATQVTWLAEEAIRSVPGVREVRSNTSRGAADIDVNFDWGDDIIVATLQVKSAINEILPSLPPGTAFTVRRMDPTVFPVLAYSLTSESESLSQLRDLALYQLRPLLSTVKGVARVAFRAARSMKFKSPSILPGSMRTGCRLTMCPR